MQTEPNTTKRLRKVINDIPWNDEDVWVSGHDKWISGKNNPLVDSPTLHPLKTPYVKNVFDPNNKHLQFCLFCIDESNQILRVHTPLLVDKSSVLSEYASNIIKISSEVTKPPSNCVLLSSGTFPLASSNITVSIIDKVQLIYTTYQDGFIDLHLKMFPELASVNNHKITRF
jgi:hypothetical protein